MGVCDEGILSPLPPCFSFGCFVSVAEDQPCCRTIGQCGPKAFEGQPTRARIMLVAAFISFIGVIFQMVPLFSLSRDATVMKNTAWTVWKGTQSVYNATTGELIEDDVVIKGYVTPLGMVIDSPNEDNEVIEWDDAENCNEDQFDNCAECEDSARGTFTVAILSFITALPQLSTDVQRSHLKGDANCQRVMGIVTGIVGLVSGLSSVTTYMASCGSGFPDTQEQTVEGLRLETELEYRWGPSLILLTFASLLKIIDVLLHMLVPVPAVTGVSEEMKKTKEEAAEESGLKSSA